MRRIVMVILLVSALLGLPGAVQSASPAAVAVQELALATNGAAYEIEPDSQGRLWISEYNAGELWRLDASGGSYQAYEVGGSPSDAHPDGSGGVWWLEDVMIHHMEIASRSMKSWFVKGSIWMWGMAVNSQGNAWISDSGAGNMLYFNPNDLKLKSYSLPNSGMGYYPAAAGEQGWVGDAVNERLLRLDAGLDRIEWWQLPPGSSPYDVAVDAAGSVWYSDRSLNQIGRLEPSANRVTVYPLPSGHQVKMLAAARGKVWFTEEGSSLASFGSLTPLAATNSSSFENVNQGYDDVSPWVDTLSESNPPAANLRSETTRWSAGTTASGSTDGGWTTYQLPGGAAPWGVAVTGQGWVVDKGRQVLVRFAVTNPNPGSFRVYIPAVQH